MTKPWDGVIPDDDLRAFRTDPSMLSDVTRTGDRPALIVVDMTRAFVDSAYRTGHSATGYPAVEATARLLSAAREAGILVVFTKSRAESEAPPTAAELGVWRHRGTPVDVRDDLPRGDVIVDALSPVAGEVVINKGGKPSAFFGTPLSSVLTYHKIDTVVVTGMVTSGCVRATVLDAFQYNYLVVVPHECCADRSQISHKVSLFDMHMKYADVVGLDEVVSYFGKVGAAT